jgi:hypothetical protein
VYSSNSMGTVPIANAIPVETSPTRPFPGYVTGYLAMTFRGRRAP